MEIVLFWFAVAIIVGIAANTRGRNGFGWFLALPRLEPNVQPIVTPVADPIVADVDAAIAKSMKKCPYCAQMIQLEALVCHFCRRDVDTSESAKVLLENEKNE